MPLESPSIPSGEEGDPPPPTGRAARRRGVLIDVDGPLLLGNHAVAGAAAVLQQLSEHQVPWALLSNTTRVTAAGLADELRGYGLPVVDQQVVTVITLLADHLADKHAGARVLWLGQGDPLAGCASVALVEDDADVVVVGGNGPAVTFDAVNHALRQLRAGAALVALHRNMTWACSEGIALDIGPIVTGLEQVAGVGATVLGKPSPDAFRLAAARAGIDVAGSMMVGDDLRNDVLAAQALGMTGVLTLTGKTTLQDLDRCEVTPHAVVASIVELPALLADRARLAA